MTNPLQDIKLKLFLGYFILTVVVGFTGWLVYNELARYSKDRVELSPVNEKIIYINDILSNLYTAEGLERNVLQSGKTEYLTRYQQVMDTLNFQLDTLTTLINGPEQKKYADSIRILLNKKQENLKELMFLKENYSMNALYQQTLKQLEESKDSIIEYYKINQSTVTKYDSSYVQPDRQNFFNRLFSAFGGQNKKDSVLQVKISKFITTDSLSNDLNPADSVANLLTSIGNEIQRRSLRAEIQIQNKENEILESDRTITLQLKKILTIVENEELRKSIREVNLQQAHNEKITRIIIILGILSLLTILYFGINILRDISKSQRYRKRLETAKSETEQVLKSKEQFMLSLAHDLKSPLNAIMGFTKLLGSNIGVKDERRYLNNIDRSSQHILSLVNGLLDLAKLQQGRLTIKNEAYNLKNQVDQIVENFRAIADKKKVDLLLNNGLANDRYYLVDPVRFTQILVNLVSNALKFTQEGHVRVSVGFKTETFEKDQVKVNVSDTGIGIDKEDLNEVFEAFSRGKAENSYYEGTGLGLTITQKLVELMNGSITIQSEPGKGSTFSVTLPMQTTNQAPKPVGDHFPVVPDAAGMDLSGVEIWIVDDDQLMLEMLEAVLKGENAVVRSFSDPLKALDECPGNAHLLITDMQMPKLDGIELLKKMKARSGTDQAAIIMSGRNEKPREALKDFIDFVQKPFIPDQMLHVIYRNLDQIKSIIKTKSTDSNRHNLYKLNQIKRFVGDDENGLKSILVSFIETTEEHIRQLRKSKQSHDIEATAELSHKMLNILRQLEVSELIEIFSTLEARDLNKMSQDQYFKLVDAGIEKLGDLVDAIQKNENLKP